MLTSIEQHLHNFQLQDISKQNQILLSPFTSAVLHSESSTWDSREVEQYFDDKDIGILCFQSVRYIIEFVAKIFVIPYLIIKAAHNASMEKLKLVQAIKSRDKYIYELSQSLASLTKDVKQIETSRPFDFNNSFLFDNLNQAPYVNLTNFDIRTGRGNICFMNSMLQVLSHVPELKTFINSIDTNKQALKNILIKLLKAMENKELSFAEVDKYSLRFFRKAKKLLEDRKIKEHGHLALDGSQHCPSEFLSWLLSSLNETTLNQTSSTIIYKEIRIRSTSNGTELKKTEVQNEKKSIILPQSQILFEHIDGKVHLAKQTTTANNELLLYKIDPKTKNIDFRTYSKSYRGETKTEDQITKELNYWKKRKYQLGKFSHETTISTKIADQPFVIIQKTLPSTNPQEPNETDLPLNFITEGKTFTLKAVICHTSANTETIGSAMPSGGHYSADVSINGELIRFNDMSDEKGEILHTRFPTKTRENGYLYFYITDNKAPQIP